MNIVPWRLSWAFKTVANNSARKIFFEETSPMTKSAAARVFISCFLMSPNSGRSGRRQRELKIAGLGSVPMNSFSDMYHFFEIFVQRIYDLPEIKAPAVILDIGANSGMFTMRARRLYPEAQISCYEPVPLNFERLHDNITRNKLRNISIHKVGIGGQARKTRLFLHPSNTGGHSILPELAGGSTQEVEIEIQSISSIVQSMPGMIDLVKIDCEGAEREIIASLSPSDAAKIRTMLIETHFNLYDRNEFLGRLAGLGFTCRFHNDLVVAQRDEPTVM